MSKETYISPRHAAIREIAWLCEQAVEHDIPWYSFCELVKARIDRENRMMDDKLKLP